MRYQPADFLGFRALPASQAPPDWSPRKTWENTCVYCIQRSMLRYEALMIRNVAVQVGGQTVQLGIPDTSGLLTQVYKCHTVRDRG
jgi:hypothetical protein